MVTLVATFGLSLILSNAALAIFKGDAVGIRWAPETLALGPVGVPLGGLYVAISSVAIIAISDLFLSRTYLGNAIRAYSQDIGLRNSWGSTQLESRRLLRDWIWLNHGRRRPPHGLAPGRDYPTHRRDLRSHQLRDRRPRRSGENVGQPPRWAHPWILIDVLPAFGISTSIAVAVAFLILIPVPPACPRGNAPMRIPRMRFPTFGPTLYGLALLMVVLGIATPFLPIVAKVQLINFLLFVGLAYALNFITGLTGYVSFGHAIFMGIGAYALGAESIASVSLPCSA